LRPISTPWRRTVRYDVVSKLIRYTGVSERFIRESSLRVPYRRYTTRLFRDDGEMTGRLDARFISYDLDRIGDRPPRR
jgi:hypothetical protein